jgi:hypothetical protein
MWADEIVVDSSAGLNPDICRVCRPGIPGSGVVSGQKSYTVGLAKATGYSCLIRRRLTGKLRNEMAELKAVHGRLRPRRNYFIGREIKHCGWSPDHSIRLFDRRRGAFKDRAVHEAVELSGEAGYLKSPMLHYTYSSISDYLTRMDRYSALAAEEMRKEGRSAGPSDMLLKPVFTFIKMFFVRQGFRDGIHGLVISMLYSFYTFSKYAKLWEMREKQ